MDPTVTVRLFSDSDVVPLTRLVHRAYAELGELGLNYTAVDQSPETTLARARGGQCWVAERDGTPVGTLTMSIPPSSELRRLTVHARARGRAWLNQVAVDPGLQGQGIANHLWSLGRSWARAEGASSVGVDTASAAHHLVRLYRRWGFEHRDLIHWDGKTYDSVVMVRSLVEPDEDGDPASPSV